MKILTGFTQDIVKPEVLTIVCYYKLIDSCHHLPGTMVGDDNFCMCDNFCDYRSRTYSRSRIIIEIVAILIKVRDIRSSFVYEYTHELNEQ